ncbi:MAG TPA: transposase [Kiritimatiellia bacterium]
MKKLIQPVVALMLAYACYPSCTAVAQEQAPNMEEILKAMGKMMAPGTNAAALVDFRELKALLPATLEGMKRTNASGEKTGAIGMTVAMAEGTYESEDGGRIDITITDMAGTGGILAMSRGWMATEIDRESDTGYERTSTMGENKAYEKYDTESKNGEIQVMVKDRFFVEIQGSDVPAGSIKAALDKVDLEKLATLKAAEAKPATQAK